MRFAKLVCGECGHVHRFPSFSTKAPKIVCACDECKARIDITPRKFFGYFWPKVTTRARA